MIDALYNISPGFLKKSYIHAFKALQYLKYRLGIIRLPETESSSLSVSTMKAYNRQRLYGFRPKLCYAPYSSMFFSRAGYMSPCYATYDEKSDRWPEKSIHEAWFHGRFENIRQAVDKGNMQYACEFCQPVFENYNFGSLLPEKYEHYGISAGKYPKIMEFELSNRCNLQCVMCDGNLSSSIRKHRDKQPPLPEVYDNRFLEELREFIPHLQMAEFTGGDPFLIPIYYEIWEMLREMNPQCKILITTNGNTWSKRIESMLSTFKNLHFNISIDSLRPEVYEKIRVGADFQSVMQNTERFINYCHKHNTTCNILVCPMSINLNDLPELVSFGNEHGCGVFFHTVVKPQKLSLKYQSADFLHQSIEKLKTFTPPRSTYQEKQNAGNYHSMISQLESWHQQKRLQEIETTRNPETAYAETMEALDKRAREKVFRLVKALENDYQRASVLTLFRDSDAETIKQMVESQDENRLLQQARKQLNEEVNP
jgi:MoaA/NifB/PqqE/SkfB family radical SAM enzyme